MTSLLEKAGFVDIARFDHSFGISSAQTFYAAPNIQLSLEVAFQALENANIPISLIKGWTKDASSFCSQVRVREVGTSA